MKYPRSMCAVLALWVAACSAQGALSSSPPTSEPKTPREWFERAGEQMNIRTPGSTPFHMKVSFRAFPGEQLPDPGWQPDVIAGDGSFEEVWMEPHVWRREVNLAGYHAIEAETGQGRTFQGSSDYEPSRVLMLLKALMVPVPRDLSSIEYKRESGRWSLDRLNSDSLPLVRISRSSEYPGTTISQAYYFLPDGLLVARNDFGLETRWSDDAAFHGMVVPRSITIRAGDRELLTATVAIEEQRAGDVAVGDISAGKAEPGQTLRPLQHFEIKIPEMKNDPPTWFGKRNDGVSMIGVIDRTGHYREVELVVGITGDLRSYQTALHDLRGVRWTVPKIDGSPCEYQSFFSFTRDVHFMRDVP